MPMFRNVQPKHVALLVFVFWMSWLYTEISEYGKRSEFEQNVSDFMHKGKRFTYDDGEALKARVKVLEDLCSHYVTGDCPHEQSAD
jgi:hypothetical protein